MCLTTLSLAVECRTFARATGANAITIAEPAARPRPPVIPELVELGVCSFKIEGRLKTPEYVANITRHYRQAIDALLETPATAKLSVTASRKGD